MAKDTFHPDFAVMPFGDRAEQCRLHFKQETFRACLDPQCHRAMPGCVLDGILYQVIDRRLEQGTVGLDRFRQIRRGRLGQLISL